MKCMEKRGLVRADIKQDYVPGSIQIRTMTEEELKADKESIRCRIQLLQFVRHIQYCKAELMPNCIVGTLFIPNKKEILSDRIGIGYYMDGMQLVLIGEEPVLAGLWELLQKHELRVDGTTADVLADFLDLLIEGEVPFLQGLEQQLSVIEERLLTRVPKNFYQTVIHYRKRLLVLHTYYEQLINMADMLAANHNEILSEAECQRFITFGARAERLHDHVEMLREYVLQIREMYQTQIDISQNHAMNLLTVVTSLFLPPSLLVGWYGMNFANMPELQWKYGYMALILLCVLILVTEIRWFKKKGLL
ncbi:MAG: CorA family divalent cation transporter [Lachnospiraceae bacterium]|nr:CorA family divalent cation transporter [Lachnospiraceae bacterium]